MAAHFDDSIDETRP